MKFFNGFELGSLAVYDNSSHDNTREIVQAMNVTLVKAEQRAMQYNVPTEALIYGLVSLMRFARSKIQLNILFYSLIPMWD